MTPERLSEAISGVLTSLAGDGSITLAGPVPEVRIERPRQAGHGDYATNVALQLAKHAGTDARTLAGLVAERLGEQPGVAGAKVAGPGFLNVSIDATTQGQVAADVVAEGAAYGASREDRVLVNLSTDGVPLRTSKRAGTVLGIEDLVGAIGVDAARYALARYSSDSSIDLDLDLDLWSRAGSDNPVYYVQYAHSRTCAILRNAGQLDLDPTAADPALLTHELEGELVRALADYPRVVSAAATLREPHRIARYLEDTAGSYHRFYGGCQVLPRGDEPVGDLHRARLLLVEATGIVLANGLRLLGVSAPERM